MGMECSKIRVSLWAIFFTVMPLVNGSLPETKIPETKGSIPEKGDTSPKKVRIKSTFPLPRVREELKKSAETFNPLLRYDMRARMDIAKIQFISGDILEPGYDGKGDDKYLKLAIRNENFGPSFKERNISIWKDYTIKECVKKLNKAQSRFLSYSRIKDLSPNSRKHYEAMFNISNAYWKIFSHLLFADENGETQESLRQKVRAMEEKLNKDPFIQQRLANFYAVAAKLELEISQFSENGNMEKLPERISNEIVNKDGNILSFISPLGVITVIIFYYFVQKIFPSFHK
ncbi:MAG: hypothetical protein LBN94_00320 [Puniceicoccales bacterium]|jgi:hypothetical protein|nr:hypothetical protein [Puniceicoccales bacterium]